MSDKKTRILILVGGFGLYAALQFEKRRDPRFDVTVVNARERPGSPIPATNEA